MRRYSELLRRYKDVAEEYFPSSGRLVPPLLPPLWDRPELTDKSMLVGIIISMRLTATSQQDCTSHLCWHALSCCPACQKPPSLGLTTTSQQGCIEKA